MAVGAGRLMQQFVALIVMGLAFVSAAYALPQCEAEAAGGEAEAQTLSQPVPVHSTSNVCLRNIGGLGDLDDWTVVDTRRASAYHKVHARGAQNIPVQFVRSRLHLKEHELLLMGDGTNDSQLLEHCHRLREAGFEQAVVLMGGLSAWRAGGGRLAGNQRDYVAVPEISPRSFDTERHAFKWRVFTDEARPDRAEEIFGGLEITALPERQVLYARASAWLDGGVDRRALLLMDRQPAPGDLPLGAFWLREGATAYSEMKRRDDVVASYEHKIPAGVSGCR